MELAARAPPLHKGTGLRNGIVAAAAPRMATSQSVECKTDTSEGAVLSDRVRRVFGAAWHETARGRQQRRHQQLISTNRAQQNQVKHPRTILPFHLTTPAEVRPTLVVSTSIWPGNGLALPHVAADQCGHNGAAGRRPQRSGNGFLPAIRIEVNPTGVSSPQPGTNQRGHPPPRQRAAHRIKIGPRIRSYKPDSRETRAIHAKQNSTSRATPKITL